MVVAQWSDKKVWQDEVSTFGLTTSFAKSDSKKRLESREKQVKNPDCWLQGDLSKLFNVTRGP